MSTGPFPLPNAANYQNEPETVNNAIEFLEQRAIDVRRTVEELLKLLDHQERAPWPDMVEKFTSISGSMSYIQSMLKKSALLASSHEDHGALLRRHVLVPQRLQLEPDLRLQDCSQSRIYSWNHDVVPNYLRTKPNPEIESEESILDSERGSRANDMVVKQISSMNKHVDSFLGTLTNLDKQQDTINDKPTYSKDETEKLVRAIMRGDQLKMSPSQPSVSRAPGQPGMPGAPSQAQLPMAGMQSVPGGRPMSTHAMLQGGMVPGMVPRSQ